jgi:PAS domain S-box-containing protein
MIQTLLARSVAETMKSDMTEPRADRPSPPSGFLTDISRLSSDKIGAWLLAVIQSAMDGVLIIDAARELVLLNGEAERMFGYTENELLGKPLEMLISEQTRDEHNRQMDSFAGAETSAKRVVKTRFLLEGKRANGGVFPISAVLSRVTVKGETFIAAILREASEPGEAADSSASSLRRRTVSSQQASEGEKRRISKELYDDLGQRLSVLKLDMDWLEKNLPGTESPTPARIAQMQNLLDNIIVRTKSIASSLRPPMLDDFGLLPAIRWLAEDFEKKTGVACQVSSPELALPPGDPIESAIFRVVQEALLNVERHAQARCVSVVLRRQAGQLEVTICDDGVGMNRQGEAGTGCFGLIAMQERVTGLGGVLNISNIEPCGVSVYASVPV